MDRSSFAWLAAALLLAGCGGSGGSTSSGSSIPSASAVIQISWPERTRSVNAPSSALSARITLDPVLDGAPDVVVQVDRLATLPGYTAPVITPTKVALGNASMSILFFAGAGGSGEVVASAGALVKVNETGLLTKQDGTVLGAVNFSGRVEKVTVLPDQVLKIGETKDLTAGAEDSSGAPLAVGLGSFRFVVKAGAAFLTVAPSGSAKGVAGGVAQVTSEVDGVVSSPADVRVRSATPVVSSFNLDAADIAYDGTRDRLLIAPSGAGTVLQTVVLSTLSFGPEVTVPASPVQVAVSSDGSLMMAGLSDGSLRIINPVSGALVSTANLEADEVAGEILAIPGDADGFVVGVVDKATSKTSKGVWVYDGSVRRPDTVASGHSLAINPAGSRVFGYERFLDTSPSFYINRITSTGAGSVLTVKDKITGTKNRIHFSGGFVVGDGGEVLDAGSGDKLRTLALGTGPFVGSDYFNRTLTVGVSANPHAIQIFDPKTGAKKDEFPLSGAPDDVEQVVECGPGRISWRTSGAVKRVNVARDLP